MDIISLDDNLDTDQTYVRLMLKTVEHQLCTLNNYTPHLMFILDRTKCRNQSAIHIIGAVLKASGGTHPV